MAETYPYKDEIGTKSNETDEVSLENQKLQQEDSVNAPEDNYDGVVDLTPTRKKRFKVNLGNAAHGVLELNTSDMSVLTRLEELYPKLQQLGQEASLKQVTAEDSDERESAQIAQVLKKIDSQMRDIIDEIFDSNVSEICASEGSMFDPFNGEFRYEHITEALSKLYEANISDEFTKMSNRLKKKTAKYTKGR